MLWLCIHLPLLPLEVFTRHQDEARCIVILNTQQQHKQQISYCNQPAWQQGIRPGMSLATAYALSAEPLHPIPADSKCENDALQMLATLCYQFTPTVVPKTNSLWLDITSCLKLHHGLFSLQQRICQMLLELGYSLRLGLANTPTAAALLALCPESSIVQPAKSHPRDDDKRTTSSRHFPHFDYTQQSLKPTALQALLNKQMLTNLDCEQALQDKWHKLGLSTLGEILALPSAALAKRFGQNFLKTLQKLTGERPDPQQGIRVTDTFFTQQHFLDSLTQTQMLLFPAKRMLNELSFYLTARQLWIDRFCWYLQLHQGWTTLEIRLTQPQNQLDNFLSLTRLKLEQVQLHEAVQGLSLEASYFVSAQQRSQSLFTSSMLPDSTSPQLAACDNTDGQHLLDKLSMRLGQQAIRLFHLEDEHVPELAGQLRTLDSGDTLSRQRSGGHQPVNSINEAPASYHQQRPVWLLSKPIAIRSTHRSSTASLYWRGKLFLIQGPERIDSHWWQEHIQRDYYQAKHEKGNMFWVYQDQVSQGWFIHGVFA